MFRQYIGGKLVEGRGPVITVTNPANGEIVDTYSGADASQAQEALKAAAPTYPMWVSRAAASSAARRPTALPTTTT